MPRPVGSERRYLAGLDGLRAIAVLSVIAYHLNLSWAPGGLLGVGVFFVLSGYLITDLLLEQRRTTGRIALGQFWARRARRLLPALWVLLVGVVLWTVVAQPAQVTGLRDQVLAALAYLSNWWYVFQHVSYFAAFGPPSPLGHLWSLAVEEQFYLVWPLLLIAGLRLFRRRLLLVVVILAGAAVSAALMAVMAGPALDPSRVYYGTDTRAFQLLIGAALAVVLPSARLAAGVSRLGRIGLEVAGAAGLAVIGLMVWGADQYQPLLYRGGMVGLSLAAAASVAALAHPATWLSKVVGAAPLRWLGVRSYGIYLWHFPIIVLSSPVSDGSEPDLVRSALQVTATLLVAAASWRWVEEPIRRLGFRGAAAALAARRARLLRVPARLVAVAATAALTVGLATAALAGALPVPAAPAVVVQTMADIAPPWHPPRHATDLCATATPADATAAPAPPLPAPPPKPVTAIGDSIMIDTAPYLHALLPGVTVDGKVSRQMYQLPDVLAQLRAQGRLHSRLVIELGTNGPFDEGRILATLRSLGPLDRLVLVNTRVPRPWETRVNTTLEDMARQLPHTTVADWHTASVGQAQYFSEDGVHPGAAGAHILANLIAQAVDPPPVPFDGLRAVYTADCGSG